MKNLVNIEKSAFRKGEYVGYSNGVWLIRKTNSSYGNWSARHRDSNRAPLIFGFTLEEVSKKLTDFALSSYTFQV
jgi:hypothetical protein